MVVCTSLGVTLSISLYISLSLDAQVRVAVLDVLQQGVVLLAHPRLHVMAGDVMPVDTVVVEVVQDGQTVLGGTALDQLAVVRLRLTDAATLGPVVLVAHGRRGELLQLGRPEPTVNVRGLQIGTVAALEVAQPSAGPDVLLLWDGMWEVEEKRLVLRGFVVSKKYIKMFKTAFFSCRFCST